MNTKTLIATVVVVMLLAGSGAVLIFRSSADDGDEDAEYTATVWLDGEEGAAEYTGVGKKIQDIVTDALADHVVVFGSNGNIVSVDGVGNTSDNVWTVFRWASPGGWAVFSDRPSTYVDGMNIAVSHAERTTGDKGVVSYAAPDIDVVYKVYFFIQFAELWGAETGWFERLNLTEEEKRNGFWIEGTGSTVNEALANAVLKYLFPGVDSYYEESDRRTYYVYNEDTGEYEEGMFTYGLRTDMYGWFLYFLGWTDTLVGSGGDYGSWTYWSQYSYHPDAGTLDDPAHWGYNQFAFGMYDITSYRYFGLILQTTLAEDDVYTAIPAPSTIPDWL